MGFIKDAKVPVMPTEAQKAIDAGQRVFVCRINQGALQSNWSGPLDAVAEQIEAIEGLGWAGLGSRPGNVRQRQQEPHLGVPHLPSTHRSARTRTKEPRYRMGREVGVRHQLG